MGGKQGDDTCYNPQGKDLGQSWGCLGANASVMTNPGIAKKAPLRAHFSCRPVSDGKIGPRLVDREIISFY